MGQGKETVTQHWLLRISFIGPSWDLSARPAIKLWPRASCKGKRETRGTIREKKGQQKHRLRAVRKRHNPGTHQQLPGVGKAGKQTSLSLQKDQRCLHLCLTPCWAPDLQKRLITCVV
jgi:hypothetical protein